MKYLIIRYVNYDLRYMHVRWIGTQTYFLYSHDPDKATLFNTFEEAETIFKKSIFYSNHNYHIITTKEAVVHQVLAT